MLERRTLPFLFSLGITGTALAAAGSLDRALPHGYAVPGLDGTPVTIESAVENKTVAAWTYRSGLETDLAVAVLDASGTWSEPVYFGRADGLDQVQPSLAVDSSGTVYLAMTTLPSREIWLAVLPAGGAWTTPVAVTVAGEPASRPTVRVVADRLVIAYRSGGVVAVRDLPLYVPIDGEGVQDGPDILPPSADSTGDDGSGDSDDDSSGGMRPKKK
jgi:hypothetical protein